MLLHGGASPPVLRAWDVSRGTLLGTWALPDDGAGGGASDDDGGGGDSGAPAWVGAAVAKGALHLLSSGGATPRLFSVPLGPAGLPSTSAACGAGVGAGAGGAALPPPKHGG